MTNTQMERSFQDPNIPREKPQRLLQRRLGHNCFFKYCARQKFLIEKGDISGAFLQGDDLEEEMWHRPSREICKELGVSEGTPMLIRKAAYGLVQAPLHWHKSVCAFLKQIGYRRLKTEPRCWVFKDKTGVKSITHGHVDDFLFQEAQHVPSTNLSYKRSGQDLPGKHGNKRTAYSPVRASDKHQDYSVELDQQKTVEELEEIHVS